MFTCCPDKGRAFLHRRGVYEILGVKELPAALFHHAAQMFKLFHDPPGHIRLIAAPEPSGQGLLTDYMTAGLHCGFNHGSVQAGRAAYIHNIRPLFLYHPLHAVIHGRYPILPGKFPRPFRRGSNCRHPGFDTIYPSVRPHVEDGGEPASHKGYLNPIHWLFSSLNGQIHGTGKESAPQSQSGILR